MEADEVEPLVVEEFAHPGVGGEDSVDELGLALDDDGKAARFMDERRAVVDGLERKAVAKVPGVAFDDAEACDHLMDRLVAGAKVLGVDAGSVVLEVDPAGDDDRSG